MYPICYRWVSGRYFQPEPAIYSRCFHWFPGPLAPSVNGIWHWSLIDPAPLSALRCIHSKNSSTTWSPVPATVPFPHPLFDIRLNMIYIVLCKLHGIVVCFLAIALFKTLICNPEDVHCWDTEKAISPSHSWREWITDRGKRSHWVVSCPGRISSQRGSLSFIYFLITSEKLNALRNGQYSSPSTLPFVSLPFVNRHTLWWTLEGEESQNPRWADPKHI